MAVIERKRRKDGGTSFQVKVRDPDGNWYPTHTFAYLEEAKHEEARLLGLKRKGARSISQDAKTTTFRDYAEVWCVENRTEVSEGWKKSQNQMLRDYILPVIGHYMMVKIGTPEIGRVMSSMKDKGLGDQMRKHVYSVLRKMFADAVEYYEMLALSPVKAKFHRPKVVEKQRNFLQPSDAMKLLESCRDHYLGPAVWLETLAGLRCEAMQGLQWQDIFWEQSQLVIRRAWKQKVRAMSEYPKGKSWEYVPMARLLKEYLWGLKEMRSPDLNEFICRSVHGAMLPYETFARALPKLCGNANVPAVTPHELRHSCTELWIQQGASREDITRLLNHKNDSAATAKYIHRSSDRLDQIGERVGLRLVGGGRQ